MLTRDFVAAVNSLASAPRLDLIAGFLKELPQGAERNFGTADYDLVEEWARVLKHDSGEISKDSLMAELIAFFELGWFLNPSNLRPIATIMEQSGTLNTFRKNGLAQQIIAFHEAMNRYQKFVKIVNSYLVDSKVRFFSAEETIVVRFADPTDEGIELAKVNAVTSAVLDYISGIDDVGSEVQPPRLVMADSGSTVLLYIKATVAAITSLKLLGGFIQFVDGRRKAERDGITDSVRREAETVDFVNRQNLSEKERERLKKRLLGTTDVFLNNGAYVEEPASTSAQNYMRVIERIQQRRLTDSLGGKKLNG